MSNKPKTIKKVCSKACRIHKMISKEALEEYKAIYKKEFGKDLSDKEALEQTVNLLTIMNVVYRPLKKSWLEGSEDNQINDKH